MSHASLVVGNNVGGNYYPKYTTRNPLARCLVAGFLEALDDLVRRTGARDIHEVGCGEGFLSTRLAASGVAVRGSDLSAAAVAAARQRAADLGAPIPFQVADLYGLDPERDGAELVVCCEVLEHLPDPGRALDILAGLGRPHVIASVPREPLWRLLNVARGKYWRELGNTPGHLQHWSSARFTAMLESRLELVEVRKPFPWTMALCRVR
jgi:SAM-dependent methyltransferase